MTATPAPLIGAICDDLTGATDLASMLVRGGMQVVQYAGLPTPGKTLTAADALVIALKSRSIPKAEAVEQSLDACRFLKKAGVRQVYFKYCSNFDILKQVLYLYRSELVHQQSRGRQRTHNPVQTYALSPLSPLRLHE